MDTLPADQSAYLSWVRANAHIQFLEENAHSDELVIYAAGRYTFIHSLLVPRTQLLPLDKADLVSWNCTPFTLAASYVTYGTSREICVDRDGDRGAECLRDATNPIFIRDFEGERGKNRTRIELNQELAHLEGVHWLSEHGSYARYDSSGDLEHVFSITTRADDEIALVTCKRSALELYLAATDQSLVRLFDFSLIDHATFVSWEGDEVFIDSSDTLFYRQRVTGRSGYTRGVQIVDEQRPRDQIFDDAQARWSGNDQPKEYVEFLAHDWRNQVVTKISTDPIATTNYFEAESNTLPYETSPAFFKPEVLLKYKADKDKYTLSERQISCRAAWHLSTYDINDAGQVHTYICYLCHLPYNEQLHWLAHNEPPKANVSERAITTDFKGEFSSSIEPLEALKLLAQEWANQRVPWWNLGEQELLERVSVPVTSSRDEWAESFMDLAKLIVEGFSGREIRKVLERQEIEYEKTDGSIALLKKLVNHASEPAESIELSGLRSVQSLRTSVKGHRGSDKNKIATDTIKRYGSFAAHFRSVCEDVLEDMKVISETVSRLDQ